MPPGEIVAWTQFVGTTAAAVLAVGGVFAGAYRYTIGRTLKRLGDDLAVVKKQVEPNGTDVFLEEGDRGQTTRTLVVRSRVDIARIDRRLEAGSERMDQLEARGERSAR